MKPHKDQDTFHLGLTMAGAVSAGAYTGGVMDYLFEALDKWDKAKKGELEGVDPDLVPKHHVVIDAMGGTSAGGMTTIMAALYAIQGKINYLDKVPEQPTQKQGNIFWDSWILLDDDAHKKTLIKALSTHDLDTAKKVLSGLNSDFIDRIAERAFTLEGSPGQNPTMNLPDYFSKDLQILISHSMIRGIPLAMPFPSGGASLRSAPSHSTYEHFLFSHFHLHNGHEVDRDQYIWLNPYDARSQLHLKKAAKATGAFPVGLKFREFDKNDFSTEYIKNVLSRLIMGDMSLPAPKIKDEIEWDNCALDQYLTNSVDGGALNNEPYAEVQSLIHGIKEENIMVNEHPYQMQGMVMIDPFPDFFELRGQYKHASDLPGLVPGIIGMLWDQAKIKRREMKEMLDDFKYYDEEKEQYIKKSVLRGTIFPVKYDANGRKMKYPIACGSLEAFGGFLDIDFRVHDFFLGRNNARTYLRSYLSAPYDPANGIVHPLHQNYWTEDMRKRFLIQFPDGSKYLPLIPDMNMLIDNKTSKEQAKQYDVPELPKISEDEVKAIKKPLNKRAWKMLRVLLKKSGEKRVSWKRILLYLWLVPVIILLLPILIWLIPVLIVIYGLPARKALKMVMDDLKERGLMR
jgi:hypothetical protein